MEYRRLGRSDVRVSCLALGGNIFGHFCNQQETIRIIHAAHDCGINLIDTTDVYSEGRSEEFIGSSIHGMREQWVIATKVGVRKGESPAGKGHEGFIRQSVEESLRRLRTDYIDLYGLHHFDPETPLEETLATLHSLVQEGKVRLIGVSNFSGDELRRSLEGSVALDLTTISSTQSHYNLLKREAERDVFPVCREYEVGLVVYGALARGILSGKYHWGEELPFSSRALTSSSIRSDLTQGVLKVVEALADFAKRRDRTVTELALAWILRKTEVVSLTVGVRSVAQLEANIHSIDWKLSDSEMNEIDGIVGDRKEFHPVSFGVFRGGRT